MVDALKVMKITSQFPRQFRRGLTMDTEIMYKLSMLMWMRPTREKEKEKDRQERAREAQCFATIAVEKGTCRENA